MTTTAEAIDQAIETLTRRLLAKRTAAGHWEGWLASSALSTATAVTALALARGTGERQAGRRIHDGIGWLARTQNADGGWGDTVRSRSNLSTTLLAWGALSMALDAHPAAAQAVSRVIAFLRREVEDPTPERIREAIIRRYGSDRTFSVPILTVLAITGRLGEGRAAWRLVPQLPFELAVFPHRVFQFLRLPVVSYALPALIAIGQARHHHAPTRSPLLGSIRSRLEGPTLETLLTMQPPSGGYLEATPLTSFVVMSLIAAGRAAHPVASAGLRFLETQQRPDGSWPIDANLATWLTTLAVKAFGADGLPPEIDRVALRRWLLDQQFRVEHPFTHAAAGGWAWTDRPGGVPDADDTAGALLALRAIGASATRDPAHGAQPGPTHGARPDPTRRDAAAAGIAWLLELQNRDGGIPTFCRGWGALPFDRSAPDLTAHALQAWAAWRDELSPDLQRRIGRATTRALRYLARAQRPDGAWLPLWFGNEHAEGEENPVYGTARVLDALARVTDASLEIQTVRARGVAWLLDAQHADGGWGGDRGVRASVEETGLALHALVRCGRDGSSPRVAARLRQGFGGSGEASVAADAVRRAAEWLVERCNEREPPPASPIGLYFARLWYFEELYPIIFPLAGLREARRSDLLTQVT